MMSIGIDAVEIERFTPWFHFSKTKLSRILSDQEITYSLSVPIKTAERLAVRFAAKEAFFKALSSTITTPLPFLLVVRNCEVALTPSGRPELLVNWGALGITPHETKISLTHTETTAFAAVILL